MFSILGFVWLPLGCSHTEPQATTPQTAPSAAPTANTAPLATATATSGDVVSPVSGPTSSTPGAAPETAAAAATTGSGNKWPFALGGEQSSPPTAATNPPHASTEAPEATTAVASLGQEASKFSGCLAKAPTAQTPTRSGPAPIKDPWRATAMGNAVLVTHTFDHACCLTGKTTTHISGKIITIEEHLTGEPCRCVCQSTIQTRVPAAPGTYDVRTVTVTNGVSQTGPSQPVTVGISAHPSK